MSRFSRIAAALLLAFTGTTLGQGQLTNTFTFQGSLSQGGSPATGTYDLRFRLYDSPTGGTQIGPMICADNVSVSAGAFSVPLDFGAQFNGLQRYLEIDVRQDTGLTCSSANGFTLLTPRQALTAEPYALWSKTASALGAPDGSPTNAVYVDNNGNVGVGTTLPTAPLQISMPPAGSAALRVQGLSSGAANTAFLSFANSLGTDVGYVGDGSTGDNTVFLGSYLGDVCLTTQTGGRILNALADGTLRLGTGSGDYRRFIVGGGNSDGFIYGSWPAFGDGIHMGYNYYADASGVGHLVHSDGGTSRLTTGYGTIGLHTGNVGQAPIRRLTVEADGTTHIWGGTSGQYDAGFLFADPSPSTTWPQGTYPFGTPFNSAGALTLRGPAGNVRLGVRSRFNGGFSVFPNQGELYMDDATGTDRITMSVNGESGATYGFIGCDDLYVTDLKHFITPHPDHPDTDIIYTCIEGPEAGIYLRGTAHLVRGRAHIGLPDTFSSIASKEGLTVILTPLSLDSRGLACTNRSIYGFDVGELLQGAESYDFDWEIKAIRRGCRDTPVTAHWTEHAHGDKPLDALWNQRLSDIQIRNAKFAAEDAQLGPRP